MNPGQQDLLTVEPVPRTRAGTHLERTGPTADGPLLEVCDACGCDASWNPGLCPTPEAHQWTDPGYEAGEEPLEPADPEDAP